MSTSERSLKSCIWSSSSGSLFSSGPLSLLFSNIQPILGPFLICMHIFCKMVSSVGPMRDRQHLLWGGASLFDPQGAFLCMCCWSGLLDLRSDRCGHLIFLLWHSSAPAINFVLEVSGGKTRLQFTQLDKLQLLRPAAHLPLPSDPHTCGGDTSFSSLFSSYFLSSVLSPYLGSCIH